MLLLYLGGHGSLGDVISLLLQCCKHAIQLGLALQLLKFLVASYVLAPEEDLRHQSWCEQRELCAY